MGHINRQGELYHQLFKYPETSPLMTEVVVRNVRRSTVVRQQLSKRSTFRSFRFVDPQPRTGLRSSFLNRSRVESN